MISMTRPPAASALVLWLLGATACAQMNERVLSPLGGDAFTLFPGPVREQRPTCTGSEAERFACFAQEFQTRAAERGVAGILATVNAEGRVRIVTHDVPGSAPAISESTDFPLGSVSKLVVGATVAALVADGQLSLSEPIVAYLPELDAPQGAGSANLGQLLSHSAGLLDPPLCEPARNQVADIVRRYGNQPLGAPPGVAYNYSTLGYVLAVAVIERVTQQSFARVSTERVLAPAGLPRPRFGPDSLVGNIPSRECGAVWSSMVVLDIREFARWVEVFALLDRSPLGQPLVEQVTAPRMKTGGAQGESYGLGIGSIEKKGLWVFAHSGRVDDFSAFAGWSTAPRFGVAAFARMPDGFPSGAGARALSTFLDLPVDWSDLTPSRPLAEYAGRYIDEVGQLGELAVAVEAGHLVIDYPLGAPALRPPEFHFFLDAAGDGAAYVATAVGFGKRVR
ncbi:MAG TPA: serine hydrolase [Polyangiaceae bacterium]|nr:serine hydrolase [Polyangiaceae bacterium]